MSTATAPTQLDVENPWPGLESFQENAHAFFFGRDRETESLLTRVLDAPVTVLYGRSGLGKTSLLQAGLFPMLRDRDFLPVYVRFQLKPDAAPLTTQLLTSAYQSIRTEVPDAPLPSGDESLWEYLHRRDFELWSRSNYPLTPVLVLDQFEELFTLGERVPELVDEFRNALGDLVENRIPSDLAARIDEDPSVADRFDLRARNYKLLVSLREDFLPDLDGWTRLIPALGRSRIRLLPLRATEALDAVRRPAGDLMTEALARRVVDVIDGEDAPSGNDAVAPSVAGFNGNGAGSEVEPALLSLFCRELNEERKRRGLEYFDEALVEDAKRDILSNYYRSCVGSLPPRVAEFIEMELITEKGFRDSYIREDAVPSHLTEDELTQLVSCRLLRLEERYGAQRIELTHDVLTGVVRENRDRRRADEEKAALAAHAEREREALKTAAAEQEAELTRERRVGRRLRWLSAVLAVVCVVSVILAYVAVKERRAASDRLKDATAQRLFGESQLTLAGLGPGRSDDVLGIQESAAAFDISSTHKGQSYPLLTAMNQVRDLMKIIDLDHEVATVAFSRDGNRIASAGTDGSIRLWDAASGNQIGGPLRGHDDWVRRVAFSPDGSRIVSASDDSTVRLWDATTGRQIGEPLRGHDGPVYGVAFSPDGGRITSVGGDGTIRFWDVGNGRGIGTPIHGNDRSLTDVAYSPDGRRLATACVDGTVQLWDTFTGKEIGEPLRGHEGLMWGLAFSPDGTRIATAGADKTIRLWDAGTGKQIGEPLRGNNDWANAIAFSPDGNRIASAGADKTIRLWDVNTGKQIGEPLTGHDDAVNTIAFSPDGRRLVSGSDDHTVRVWDVTSWQPMVGHTNSVALAMFSTDGSQIMSGSLDDTMQRWDAATGRPVGGPLRVDDKSSFKLLPADDNRLLSVNKDSTVQLWDSHTLKPIGAPLPFVVKRWFAWDDPVDRWAAQTEDNVVRVWDAPAMSPTGTPITLEKPISTIMMSDDGRIIATGTNDGAVRVWDAASGEMLGQPMNDSGGTAGTWGRGVTRIAISHDNHLLAVSRNDLTLRLWNVQTSQPVGAPIDSDETVVVTAFNQDGSVLASGGNDGSIRLWDVGDQSQIGPPLIGHTGSVTSLHFNPDGTKLLSSSEDGTVRMWPVHSATPDWLCARITHNMSADQWNRVVPEVPQRKVCPNLPDAEDAGH